MYLIKKNLYLRLFFFFLFLFFFLSKDSHLSTREGVDTKPETNRAHLN